MLNFAFSAYFVERSLTHAATGQREGGRSRIADSCARFLASCFRLLSPANGDLDDQVPRPPACRPDRSRR